VTATAGESRGKKERRTYETPSYCCFTAPEHDPINIKGKKKGKGKKGRSFGDLQPQLKAGKLFRVVGGPVK